LGTTFPHFLVVVVVVVDHQKWHPVETHQQTAPIASFATFSSSAAYPVAASSTVVVEESDPAHNLLEV
jgi:hypothetical protein